MSVTKTKDTRELLPIIRPGAWVILDHSSEVPKELRGRIAAVEEAQILVDDGESKNSPSPRRTEFQPEDAWFIVRTRDEIGAILSCKRSAFAKISTNGRQGLYNHG